MGGDDVFEKSGEPLASLLLEIDSADVIKITVSGNVKYLISKLDYSVIVSVLEKNKKKQ